jgi:hypothetical protein
MKKKSSNNVISDDKLANNAGMAICDKIAKNKKFTKKENEGSKGITLFRD